MSSFKEVAAADLAVFFNLDEHGEQHTIDGRDITVIVDTETLQDRARRNSADLYHATGGVYVEQILFFVRASDLPERPVIGQSLRFDGERYEVSNCIGTEVLEITLEANRS